MNRRDTQTLHDAGVPASALRQRYELLPFRAMPASRIGARQQHLLREIGNSAKPRPFMPRFAINRRRALLPLAAALVLVGTAAAATTSWLVGSPAPQTVVNDFKSYATQLGFHPVPGHAVLVADSNSVSLYATVNQEGGYCLIASAPWKRPGSLSDGGTCVAASDAAAPFVAGTLGLSNSPGESATTLVLAGRTTNSNARMVRFEDSEGILRTERIGSSGFFVDMLETPASPCSRGDWAPTFVLLGQSGERLTSATVTVASDRGRGVCTFVGPHG
jgi:hypothetical protein